MLNRPANLLDSAQSAFSGKNARLAKSELKERVVNGRFLDMEELASEPAFALRRVPGVLTVGARSMPIRVPYNPARFVRLSVWNGRGVGLLIAAAMANGCSAGPLAEPMVTVASKPEVVTVASHMPLEPLPKIQ